MKNWKLLICLISLVFFILAATACQQSGAANSVQLRGALQNEDDGSGLYIRSGGKRYHIDSQQDLSAMVGKIVTLEGTTGEKDGKTTITVSSVKDQ